MKSIDQIRSEFPALSQKSNSRDLVYLDNAATSQRPSCVQEKWTFLSLGCNANIHRAVYGLAARATEEYESTRQYVARFLNASSEKEIVFTSGATMSLNLVAYTFGMQNVRKGDEVFVAESEHHSNLVPWQNVCQRKGALLRPIPVDETGHIGLDFIKEKVSSRAKVLCVAQVSNVLGLENPLKEIIRHCHSVGCAVVVDGAQGVVHCPVDVQDLDCDFYAFSGHKIYAATGTGVLYGKKELLDSMTPFLFGGEMIDTVRFQDSTFAETPQKFEAGTQNFNAIPTLMPAIDTALMMRSNVECIKEQKAIADYILQSFEQRPDIRLYGKPDSAEEKIPLFSFSVKGVHHEDMALILDKLGVAVRSGQMCAEPLMDRYEVTGMVRASFAPYNTLAEAKYFIESLDRAIEMLK